MKSRNHPANPFECLESRTLLGADLAVSLGAITIDHPGQDREVISVPTTLSNVGDAGYNAGGTIHYFLSQDQTLSADDLSWTSMAIPSVDAGAASNLILRAPRPERLVASADGPAVPAGQYYVIATLEFPSGVSDDNAANNTAATPGTVSVDYRFGDVDGHHVALVVRTGDSRFATFKLDGPGTGTVVNDNGRILVTVDGTSGRNSTLVIDGNRDAAPVINGITISGSALRVRVNHVAVDGNISVGGTLQELNAGDISGGTVSVGQAGRFTDMRVGNLSDVTITSPGTIKTLDVNNWSAGDAAVPDVLSAATVEHLIVRHDMGADVTINHSGRGDGLKNADIRGSITGGTWIVSGSAGDLSARSTASGWSASISGDLKSLRVFGDASGVLAAHNIRMLDFKHNVGGMTVLAGANLGSDGRLGGTDAAADTFSGATIQEIKINGNLTDSTIAAGVDPVNGVFGDSDDVYLSPSRIVRMRVKGTTSNSQVLATLVNSSRTYHQSHGNSQGHDGGSDGQDGESNGGNQNGQSSGNQNDSGQNHDRSPVWASMLRAAQQARARHAVGFLRLLGQ